VAVALISKKAAPLLGKEHLPEQAFFLFVNDFLPDSIAAVIPIFIFGLFAAAVESQLNWAGSLLDSVTPNRWKQTTWSPYLLVALVLVSAIGCALVFDRIYHVVNFLLGISAGVSIIFVLRWFTPRINAQVQLSAMLGAILYTFLVKLAMEKIAPGMSAIDAQWYLIVSVTFLVLATSIIVSILTYNKEDAEIFKYFRILLPLPRPLTLAIIKSILMGISLVLFGFFLFRFFL
jgi:hypothetical protein